MRRVSVGTVGWAFAWPSPPHGLVPICLNKVTRRHFLNWLRSVIRGSFADLPTRTAEARCRCFDETNPIFPIGRVWNLTRCLPSRGICGERRL